MPSRVALAVLILASCLRGACLHNANGRIAEFSFSGGSRVDAILALGKQVNACFALRNLPRSAFLEQVVFHFQGESPLDISRKIFQTQHVAVVQSPEGTIEISRARKTETLFDYVIPSFVAGRTTLQVLSQGIKNRLKVELNPEIQGIAGSFYSGDQSDLVGPFDERGKTVGQLLNLIVSASKGATWLAQIPDSSAVRSSAVDQMWTVIEYNRPMADYKNLIATIGSNYPDREDQ